MTALVADDEGEAAADAEGDAAAAGAPAGLGDGDGVGVGDATGTASDCSTEFEPLIPGSDNDKAISMNAIAAPMVIFAKMFCVPRGPNAVLETLLVNKAPASALPGCSNTTTTSTKQARMNNVYKV